MWRHISLVWGENAPPILVKTLTKESRTPHNKVQSTNYRTKRNPPPYLLQYSISFPASGIYSYLHLLNGSEGVAAGTEIQNSSRHIPFQFATKWWDLLPTMVLYFCSCWDHQRNLFGMKHGDDVNEKVKQIDVNNFECHANDIICRSYSSRQLIALVTK